MGQPKKYKQQKSALEMASETKIKKNKNKRTPNEINGKMKSAHNEGVGKMKSTGTGRKKKETIFKKKKRGNAGEVRDKEDEVGAIRRLKKKRGYDG